MRIATAVYNAFLWAFILAVTAFGNVWLEMRVNMGWVLAGCWLVFSLALCLGGGKLRRRPGFCFSAANTVVCYAYAFILLGAKRLAVVPAAIIREGLNLPKAPFASVNAVLIIVLLLWLLMLFIMDQDHKL